MVARRTLLLFWILLTCVAGQTTRLRAASSPPELLSPRTIDNCFTAEHNPAVCEDGDVRELDAAVDGSIVSFTSYSNRFVAGDRNVFSDIFVWQDGSVQQVSIGAHGEESDHASDHPAISGNGRYVYFRSQASTFVTGATRGKSNLYLKDLVSGRLMLISHDTAGLPVNGANLIDHFMQIDTDFSGRYVVFSSNFANFVEGIIDINLVSDVFLADVDPDGNGDYFDSAPHIYLLSAIADGSATGNGASFEPTISQDGAAVAWLTRATDLAPGLASNGITVDVVLARLGKLSDGSVDPATRTLFAINRMGNDTTTLTPHNARLARIDPWRDQVAFVTATNIPGSGDDHVGDDLYLSVGEADDANSRQLVWMSHAYSATAPTALSLAWDPALPPAMLSQAGWIAQNNARIVDDLLLQRSAPFHPQGWSTVNWVDANTPSSEAVRGGVLSADGRFAFWTTLDSYSLDVPADSENLFRREIAPPQSVALTVNGVGGAATYAPTGVLLNETMFYSPTTVVTLTPLADVGYRFRAWEGVDYSQGMTATVIVYAGRTVTATFDPMTPPIVDSMTVTVAEEASLEGITLTINDPDPDESHQVSLAEPPAHGVTTVVNNVISYTPAANFSGQDQFALQVVDAYGLQLAQAASVTVMVTPVGDAPVADDLKLSIAEDTLLSDIALAVSDTDGDDSHTLSLTLLPSHGTATLLDNLVSYQPAPNFNGQESFALQVEDAYGLRLAEAAQVTIEVTPVNDAPTAADLTLTVAEDALLTDIALAIDDPDTNDRHIVTLAASPDHGTVTLLNNVATYQPNQNFNGEDEFTLQVTDSGNAHLATPATVQVQVTPVNDAPTLASAQGSGVNNGEAIPIFVSVQDPDAEDSYTLALETSPTAGSVQIESQLQAQHFAFTPLPAFAGVDSFTFRLTDSGNATITGTATVTVTLAPPVPPVTPMPPSGEQLRLPTLRRAP